MHGEETLAIITKQPKNAKSAIIQKLSKEWPLSTKQLTHSIQREYGLAITYQAVHKAIHELENEKILQKKGSKYQLHEEWIQGISQLSQNIAQKYAKNEPLTFDKEIIQLNFTKWIDVGRFVSFDFLEGAPNPEKKPIVTCWRHVWPINTVSIEETQRLTKIAKKEDRYFICSDSTTLDKIFSNYLENMNMHNLTGRKMVLDHDYIVKGKFIAQVYYKKKFYDKVNSFYIKTKDINTIDYSELQKLVTEKTQIHVIILQNKELAEKLREEGMEYFKRK